MLEKLRKALDNSLFTGFDCLQYDLLKAQLHAYGFSEIALKLLWSYLTGRK